MRGQIDAESWRLIRSNRCNSTMDRPLLDRLLVARGLLEKARSSRDGTIPGEITALVLIDLAVETGAKALAGPAVDKEANFHQTLKVLNVRFKEASGMSSELEGTSHMKEMRSLRNGVQHAGNSPSPTDIDRYSIYAEDFLIEAVSQITKIALQDLSMAHLLDSKRVRKELNDGDRAWREGHADAAAEHLAVAIQLLFSMFRAHQPAKQRGVNRRSIKKALEPTTSQVRVSSNAKRKFKDGLVGLPGRTRISATEAQQLTDRLMETPPPNDLLLEVLTKLSTDIELLSRRVEAAAVVGDVGDFVWFQMRIGTAHPMLEDGEYVYTAPDPALDGREFARAFRFVVDAGLRIQEMEKSPPAPGSIRSWLAKDGPL